jgi:hypothetical protein
MKLSLQEDFQRIQVRNMPINVRIEAAKELADDESMTEAQNLELASVFNDGAEIARYRRVLRPVAESPSA